MPAELAPDVTPGVGFSDSGNTDKFQGAISQRTEPHLALVAGPDVTEIDVTTRDGQPIGRLYILGGEDGNERLLIGVSLHDKTRTLTANVLGPMVQMTSEHAKSAGRSVAAFPGSTLVEVEVSAKGDADVE